MYAAVVSGYGGAYPLPPTCFIGSRQVRSCLCRPLAGAPVSTGPPSIAAIGQELTRASCILPAGPPIASRPIHVRGFALAPRLGQRRTTKKKPRNISVLGLCMRLGIKLTLAELGSATSGFEAVLKCSYVRFSLRFRAFRAFPLKVAPLFNHKMGTSDARFYCRNASFTTLTSSSGLLYFT